MAKIPENAKKVFQGEIYAVWQWEQELYDGSTATFEALSRTDYAGIIGITPDKKILVIRDEQPGRSAVLTPAGGRVEASEDPQAGATRELLEETGYKPTEVIPWFTHEALSRVQMGIHIFIGRGITKVAEPALEAGERVEPLLLTFEEFLELGSNEQMRDLHIRIKLLEAQLDPKKKEELRQLLFGE